MVNPKYENEKWREIKRIEDKYGLLGFRCGLTHLINCGAQILSDPQEIEETKEQIREITPANSIMTADFQCDIVDCAVELASIDVWDLFRYIQSDVAIEEWH